MNDITSRIEHTVLGPTTTWSAVSDVLDQALRYGMRACIPPCYLERAGEYAPGVDLVTVVGFPHGQHLTETKCDEADHVWQAGATEIDFVANVGHIKSGNLGAARAEFEEVVAAVPVPVKVIVESPLLDADELRAVSEVAAATNVAYLKTSTGFTDGGATVADVELMSEYCPVKASGGIRSWEFTRELMDAGAERIGSSSGDVILEEYRNSRNS